MLGAPWPRKRLVGHCMEGAGGCRITAAIASNVDRNGNYPRATKPLLSELSARPSRPTVQGDPSPDKRFFAHFYASASSPLCEPRSSRQVDRTSNCSIRNPQNSTVSSRVMKRCDSAMAPLRFSFGQSLSANAPCPIARNRSRAADNAVRSAEHCSALAAEHAPAEQCSALRRWRRAIPD